MATFFFSDIDVAENFYRLLHIDPNQPLSVNEQILLRFFKKQELGLELYRGDLNDFDSWTRIRIKNNGDLKENECN